MPKQSPSNSNATSSSSSSASAPKSDYQYYKAYGGWHGFMQSYGLKPYDLDDVQEGKDIIAGFRNIDGAGADAGKAGNK
jgi:hypothetical protein